ncbi:MAG: hypothetical protein ACRCXB_25020 [Aeromonadaceae bacterium]
MKKFFTEVAKLVISCALLLMLSASLNWKTNHDRMTEYRELSSKVDAMAESIKKINAEHE